MARRRRLWLTIPLYVLLIGVLVLDGWAAVFWMRVGGQLGMLVAGAAGVVILVIGVLLVTDARRQWLLGSRDRAHREFSERPAS
ncbi:hypothetical protein GB931_08275 [Modestobacter sp. I12A-02628]|uniref:Uncharacterized protein n=1 Tax=Goekera deserti TaxID=2497753 RepID=A0A7K3WF99_9ACTN|nr:hypothetical protein [Goekera deserti]MPQ97919.1 hypothetical protein [Goekera deserti]NDI48565.1 hypothetical protein [Goekera deserti]NEL55056.1 hypothetical protein [Goekera deserti]